MTVIELAKICFFNKWYSAPFTYGKPVAGSGKVDLEIAERFSQEGHEIAIINRAQESDYVETIGKINIFHMGAGNNSEYLFKGFRIAKNYDILFSGSYLHPLILRRFSRWKLCLLYLHDIPEGTSPVKLYIPHSTQGLDFTIMALKNCDGMIAPTEIIRRKAQTYWHVQNVQTIHHGVDPNILEYAFSKEKKNYILFVGAIVKEKGLDFLIEAFKIIHKDFPEFELKIVGSSALWNYPREYEKKIQSLADQGDGISFLGEVTDEELIDLYRSAVIVVIPSIFLETFCLVAIEAMAAGTPVVASNIGGIPEVVEDKVTGLLVPPSQSHSIAKAIEILLSDENLRRNMGLAGRTRVEKYFTWEKNFQKIQNLIKTCL